MNLDLATHPRLRLLVLSALYLVQGIPTGFVTITLAAYLAKQGYTTGAVAAFLATTYLPWALKLFYGPVIDCYVAAPMGRRRPWILLAQTGMLLTLAVFLLLPGVEHHVVLLAGLLFVYNAFNALQDVATDALAVDLLDASERGTANGVMWSSKVAGIAIGGAGMGTLMAYAGFRVAVSLHATLLLFTMLLPLLLREHPGNQLIAFAGGKRRSTPYSWRRRLGEMITMFRQHPALGVAGLALLAPLPTRMLVSLGPVFAMQAAGWSNVAFSQFTGGPALLAGAAGALAGGWVADRLGRWRTLSMAAGSIAVVIGLFAFMRPWWTTPEVVMLFLVIGIFLDMTLKTSIIALSMDATEAHAAATQFAVFMALGNLCNVLGSALIVPLDAVFDFQGLFVCAAVLGIGVFGMLRWVRPHVVVQPSVS